MRGCFCLYLEGVVLRGFFVTCTETIFWKKKTLVNKTYSWSPEFVFRQNVIIQILLPEICIYYGKKTRSHLYRCLLDIQTWNVSSRRFMQNSYLMRPLSLIVCLCFGGFSSHSQIFHSYGDVTIAGEGRQILTYDRHSLPLRSWGSLACHTYCDTGHPYIIDISEDPWYLTYCRLTVEMSLPVFTT